MTVCWQHGRAPWDDRCDDFGAERYPVAMSVEVVDEG